MAGHGAPEIEGLLFGGIVGGGRIQLRRYREELAFRQVADAVPVDDHIEAFLLGHPHSLVQQLEVILLAMNAPSRRVDGEPDDVGAPRFCRFKVIRLPLAVAFEFVRIARRQAAENDGLAIGRDKPVALHADPAELGRSRRAEQTHTKTEEQDSFHDFSNRPMQLALVFLMPPDSQKAGHRTEAAPGPVWCARFSVSWATRVNCIGQFSN
jgi:hypothetical protein